jgi:very-short-patch-repair endonuclease
MTRSLNKPLVRHCNRARKALLEARAAAMRGAPAPSERLFWQRVRGKQLGVVVRRQVPLLARFIADF